MLSVVCSLHACLWFRVAVCVCVLCIRACICFNNVQTIVVHIFLYVYYCARSYLCVCVCVPCLCMNICCTWTEPRPHHAIDYYARAVCCTHLDCIGPRFQHATLDPIKSCIYVRAHLLFADQASHLLVHIYIYIWLNGPRPPLFIARLLKRLLLLLLLLLCVWVRASPWIVRCATDGYMCQPNTENVVVWKILSRSKNCVAPDAAAMQRTMQDIVYDTDHNYTV